MNAQRRRIRAASDDPIEEMVEALTDSVDQLTETLGKSKNGNGNGGVYLPKYVVAMLVGTIMSLVISGVVTTFALDSRLDTVENTRFRDTDGAALEARLRDFHNANTPPPVVERRLSDHERRLQQQSDRLLRLEQRNGGN